VTGHRLYRFRVRITPRELLRYYAGRAATVSVPANGGSRVRFPASALRPFVEAGGVDGLFELEVDEGNRLVALRRLTSG
jgi:hypothetical protein